MSDKKYCCETMKYQVNLRCEQHPDPFDCADNLINYLERLDEYGIIFMMVARLTLLFITAPGAERSCPTRNARHKLFIFPNVQTERPKLNDLSFE